MPSPEWQAYLQTYHTQKRLEKYQQERKLPRPKTTKLTVGLYTALLLMILGGLIILLFFFSSMPLWANTVVFALCVICAAESLGRLLSIRIVECYQHYAPETTRRKCKCIPSCSEYAILCLKKHTLIRALCKIRKRLLVTCQGFDYIIDDP